MQADVDPQVLIDKQVKPTTTDWTRVDALFVGRAVLIKSSFDLHRTFRLLKYS